MKTCCHSTRFFLKLPSSTALALALVAVASAAVHDHARPNGASHEPSSPTAKSAAQGLPAVIKLPPLPAGVVELKFGEFFVTPVGARGLELSDKLRELDGQRVRMLGYMVHQESPPPGRFLLTPMPAQIHEHDNGLADDLPASTVYVSVPTLRDQAVPYAPGLMLLTGTLSVGNRPEPDGRVSLVRLKLDPPSKIEKPKPHPERTSAAKGGALLMRSSLVPSSRFDANSHRAQTANQ